MVVWTLLPASRVSLVPPSYPRALSYLLHLRPQAGADVGGQQSQSLQPLGGPGDRGPGVGKEGAVSGSGAAPQPLEATCPSLSAQFPRLDLVGHLSCPEQTQALEQGD